MGAAEGLFASSKGGLSLLVTVPAGADVSGPLCAITGNVETKLTASAAAMFAGAILPVRADASTDEKKEALELHAFRRFVVPSKTLKELGAAAPQGIQSLREEARAAAQAFQEGIRGVYDSVKQPLAHLREEGKTPFSEVQSTHMEMVVSDAMRLLEGGYKTCCLPCDELEAIRDNVTDRTLLHVLMTLALEGQLGVASGGVKWSPLTYAAVVNGLEEYLKYGQLSLTEAIKKQLLSKYFKAAASGLEMLVASSSGAPLAAATSVAVAAQPVLTGGGGATAPAVNGQAFAELRDRVKGLEFFTGAAKMWDASTRRYTGDFVCTVVRNLMKTVDTLRKQVSDLERAVYGRDARREGAKGSDTRQGRDGGGQTNVR